MEKTYYKVCPNCNANLDPGERCDCLDMPVEVNEKPEPSKILYLCDRRKCRNCNPDCKHTEDITHAENFEVSFLNYYVEKE